MSSSPLMLCCCLCHTGRMPTSSAQACSCLAPGMARVKGGLPLSLSSSQITELSLLLILRTGALALLVCLNHSKVLLVVFVERHGQALSCWLRTATAGAAPLGPCWKVHRIAAETGSSQRVSEYCPSCRESGVIETLREVEVRWVR